eukprot:7152375-Prymnesium_polylepis.1
MVTLPPRLLRSYSEGECILPEAALRAVRVTFEYRATTFVEVHALHFEDVTRLLQTRVAEGAAENEQKAAAARATSAGVPPAGGGLPPAAGEGDVDRSTDASLAATFGETERGTDFSAGRRTSALPTAVT